MSIQLLYSYSRDPSVPLLSYNGKHAKIVFHLRTFNSIFRVLQGIFNIRASIFTIEARVFFSAVGAADCALSKLGECVRCRGGQFEPEGSVLKYMTEDENAVGAADRALYIVATSSADSA